MAKDGKTTVAPKLRFPMFHNAPDWEMVPLEKVAKRVSTKNTDGKITRVLTNSAEYGVIDQRDYFDRDIAGAGKVDGYYIVDVGDFVYNPRTSMIAPVGPISRNNVGKGVMSPLYTVFRFIEKKTDFYEHFFKSTGWHSYVRNAASTGARHDRMSITIGSFMQMPVPTTDQSEQQKIADCLISLEELLAAQRRKVEALKVYKRGLMQQLFPCEGEILPRLRFPEFASTGSWHSQKISSLLSKASFPVNIESEKFYREIGIRSHGKGVFHKDPVLGKTIGEKRVFQVVRDALVLNIVFAWEQAVATTSENEIGMIASHRFPMFVAKPGKCDVEYVKWFFLTKEGKRLMGVASPGGAGRNKTLGQKEFENLEIPLPASVGEQARIANCLSSFDAKIATETEQLNVLITQRNGLMQQLFPALEEMKA